LRRGGRETPAAGGSARVTAALAHGLITPAEGQAIAKVVTTFVQTIETSDFDRRLQMLEADQTQQPSSQPRVWPYSSLTT